MYGKQISKSPRFVSFGANLAPFRLDPNLTSLLHTLTMTKTIIDDNVYPQPRKTKHYLMKTNDGSTCHRCYVHHMPSKKTFYQPAPSSPITDFELKKIPVSAPSPSTKPPESPPHRLTPLFTDSGSPMPPRPASTSPLFANRVMPPSRKYQFLVREHYGREKDLNDTPTPRLVPYEMWKDVVTHVSRQTMKASKYLPKLHRRVGQRLASQGGKLADGRESRSRRSSSRAVSRRGQSESRPGSKHVTINSRPVSRSVSRHAGRERRSGSRLGSRSRKRDV